MEALTVIAKLLVIVYLAVKMLDLVVLPWTQRIIGRLNHKKAVASPNQQLSRRAVPVPVVAPAKAAEIIRKLNKLGYFKYVQPALADRAKNQAEALLMQYGQVGFEEYDPETRKCVADCRYFGYGDAEELYEWGGFEAFFNNVRPTLEKMGVKLEQVAFPEEVEITQLVRINGVTYILYDEADTKSWQPGWGIAVERFIDMINDVLKRQGRNEKLYDIPRGGVIFLTRELYQYLKGLDLDEQHKPRKLPER